LASLPTFAVDRVKLQLSKFLGIGVEKIKQEKSQLKANTTIDWISNSIFRNQLQIDGKMVPFKEINNTCCCEITKEKLLWHITNNDISNYRVTDSKSEDWTLPLLLKGEEDLKFVVECTMEGAEGENEASWDTGGFSNVSSPIPEKEIEGDCDEFYTWKKNVLVTERDLGEKVLSCSYQQRSFKKTIKLQFYVFKIRRVEASSFCEEDCSGSFEVIIEPNLQNFLTKVPESALNIMKKQIAEFLQINVENIRDENDKFILDFSSVLLGNIEQSFMKLKELLGKVVERDILTFNGEKLSIGDIHDKCGCQPSTTTTKTSTTATSMTTTTRCEHTGSISWENFDTNCILDENVIRKIDDEADNSWKINKIDKFVDYTVSEVRDQMLGGKDPSYLETWIPTHQGYSGSLNETFDSRMRWQHLIGPIVDQNWCNMSWAVGSMTVFADRVRIGHGQHLEKEFLWKRPHFAICKHKEDEKCCSQNFIPVPWDLMRKTSFSPDNEPSYKFKVAPSVRLPPNFDVIRYEISEEGPVQAVMRVYSDLFLYGSGVYQPTDHSAFLGYHSVRIVAWGAKKEGNDTKYFWKIANSWGEEWGEDGYFRMWTNTCEIENWVVKTRISWKNPEPRKRGKNKRGREEF